MPSPRTSAIGSSSVSRASTPLWQQVSDGALLAHVQIRDSMTAAADPDTAQKAPVRQRIGAEPAERRMGSQLYTWGSNYRGQLGRATRHEDGEAQAAPAAVSLPAAVCQVACGGFHTAALTDDGQVWTWGQGSQGELGYECMAKQEAPKHVPLELTVGGVVAIACGRSHCAVVTQRGVVYSWGHGTHGQIGYGGRQNVAKPTQTRISGRVVSVACGARHSVATVASGGVFTWGCGQQGQLGHGELKNEYLPRLVASLPDERHAATSLSCAATLTTIITAMGSCFVWGMGENLYPSDDTPSAEFGSVQYGARGGDPTATTPVQLLKGHKLLQVCCGQGHLIALDTAGDVYTWGAGRFGQCGHGQTCDVYTPRLVLSNKNVIHIAAGRYHNAAVTSFGGLYTWGCGENGELGHGNEANQLLPRIVDSLLLSAIVGPLDAGEYHMAALIAPGMGGSQGARVKLQQLEAYELSEREKLAQSHTLGLGLKELRHLAAPLLRKLQEIEDHVQEVDDMLETEEIVQSPAEQKRRAALLRRRAAADRKANGGGFPPARSNLMTSAFSGASSPRAPHVQDSHAHQWKLPTHQLIAQRRAMLASEQKSLRDATTPKNLKQGRSRAALRAASQRKQHAPVVAPRATISRGIHDSPWAPEGTPTSASVTKRPSSARAPARSRGQAKQASAGRRPASARVSRRGSDFGMPRSSPRASDVEPPTTPKLIRSAHKLLHTEQDARPATAGLVAGLASPSGAFHKNAGQLLRSSTDYMASQRTTADGSAEKLQRRITLMRACHDKLNVVTQERIAQRARIEKQLVVIAAAEEDSVSGVVGVLAKRAKLRELVEAVKMRGVEVKENEANCESIIAGLREQIQDRRAENEQFRADSAAADQIKARLLTMLAKSMEMKGRVTSQAEDLAEDVSKARDTLGAQLDNCYDFHHVVRQGVLQQRRIVHLQAERREKQERQQRQRLESTERRRKKGQAAKNASDSIKMIQEAALAREFAKVADITHGLDVDNLIAKFHENHQQTLTLRSTQDENLMRLHSLSEKRDQMLTQAAMVELEGKHLTRFHDIDELRDACAAAALHLQRLQDDTHRANRFQAAICSLLFSLVRRTTAVTDEDKMFPSLTAAIDQTDAVALLARLDTLLRVAIYSGHIPTRPAAELRMASAMRKVRVSALMNR